MKIVKGYISVESLRKLCSPLQIQIPIYFGKQQTKAKRLKIMLLIEETT